MDAHNIRSDVYVLSSAGVTAARHLHSSIKLALGFLTMLAKARDR